MNRPKGAKAFMKIENSSLPIRLEISARLYLTWLGTHRAGHAGGGPEGVWKVAIRDEAGVQRRIVAPPLLEAWAARQPAAVQSRISDLIRKLTGAPIGTDGLNLSAPVLMGVVNATPDSFSDGGEHGDPAGAIEHGHRLAEAGAGILDIGGESTRPGATPVPPEEEIRLVMPVLEGLQELRRRTPKIALSIDTRHAPVMRAALEAGIDIINDVSALTGDPDSLSVAAGSDAAVVLMHMQGEPSTMNRAPLYVDVSLDVFDYLEARIEACIAAGIEPRRLIVDPGIGFGKRGPENLTILRELALFHGLGCPLLLGASRKGFGEATQALAPRDRLPTSLAAAMIGLAQGTRIVRVHDVAETCQALEIWRQINGVGR
jgi:dihydropteroate synthase